MVHKKAQADTRQEVSRPVKDSANTESSASLCGLGELSFVVRTIHLSFDGIGCPATFVSADDGTDLVAFSISSSRCCHFSFSERLAPLARVGSTKSATATIPPTAIATPAAIFFRMLRPSSGFIGSGPPMGSELFSFGIIQPLVLGICQQSTGHSCRGFIQNTEQPVRMIHISGPDEIAAATRRIAGR
jgi:hypothetical protein